MKFPVDEDLSPSIAAKLPSLGHAASHVAHVGLASTTDRALWKLALDRDEVVITANARDFLKLATGVELHPGLIVLREGALDRDEPSAGGCPCEAVCKGLSFAKTGSWDWTPE